MNECGKRCSFYVQHGALLDSTTQKVAFRRARVVQDPLVGQEGRTFLFEINNIRIFCGGAHHAVDDDDSDFSLELPQARTGSRQTLS